MRKLLLVAALGIAVIGPYLYSKSATLVKESNGTAGGLLTRLIRGAPESGASRPGDVSPLGEFPEADMQGYSDGPGLSIVDLLRFDVTPDWVTQNWKYITTDLPGTPLDGMRVPLVSGMEPQHLVGSLTYYFNANQRLERICVQGFCEDPSSVLMLAEQRFGLKKDPGAGPNTYVAFYDDNPISLMRVVSRPKRMDGELKERFEIDLELNLPRKGALLSGEKLMTLFKGHRAGVI